MNKVRGVSDAIIPRVVDKSRDALETTEEFIIDSIRSQPASNDWPVWNW